ncbi:MAG TPA: hypothetical protein VLX68_04750 [Chitinivibrionales bacterium]|nr:hypothetical protein [Chitinivibrionales bacterium]
MTRITINKNLFNKRKTPESLVNRSMSAGKQSVTWDRTNMAGKKVVNGVYMYKFTMGDKMISHHFVLAK